MIDYIYKMWQHEFPEEKLYATAFEFGTYGDGFKGKVGMPRAMSLENQLYWQGTDNQILDAKIKYDFEELFNPSEPDWKKKSVQDADQAFEGIFEAEGFIRVAG